jgi:FkbM family methyltransferase
MTFAVPPRSHIGGEVFLTDADVDWGAEALLARLVRPESVFLDIGANIGYYTAYLYPLVAAVHAFEPDERALPYLRDLARGLPRLTVHAAAVSSADGTAVLSSGASSEISALASDGSRGVEVPTVAIDSLEKAFHGPVGAMKVDTEGHEAAVLAGADRTIERDRPLLLCETVVDPPLLAWASARQYRVGAAVEIPREKLAFSWFRDPATLPTKMVFLVPENRAPDLENAAKELYGEGLPYDAYRPRLRAFREATRAAKPLSRRPF